MCGITGAIWGDSRLAVTREQLSRMTTALAHRGPDASGEHYRDLDHIGQGVALGHRRLSIIDLAGGAQPMSSSDEMLTVVFNGEIYNYRELRADLKSRGHVFQTDGDTETLLHLYDEFGIDMLDHLRGMFAFAIWDQRQQILFFARDRFGQKPLVYRAEPGRLLFASEIKSLLQVEDLPRSINPQALDAYLTFQYVPHPQCMLEGFQKLPPAHYGIWHGDQLELTRYWQPDFESFDATTPFSFEEASLQLRELLTDAVGLRLRSDVPLGAFLSGGIDSTIIAGLMQQQLDRPVETFSIGFEHSEYDERSFARMAAEYLGTNHHEQIVQPSAVDALPKLVWHYEEPFADSSAIPMLALSEMTRQHVTVALAGDGGDELFAGYDRYQAVQLADRLDALPAIFKWPLTTSLWQRLPTSVSQKSFLRRLKRFQESIALNPRLRYLQWISHFQHAQREQLYSPEFASRINVKATSDRFEQLYDQFSSRDIVTQTTAVDQMSYLPCDILTKVDIASMACGLECRSPFLDHKVGEFAARLPIAAKLRRRIGKRILRDSCHDLVPAPILSRKKMGFGVPVDHWFRGELQPLLHDYLLSERALWRGYFRRSAIETLIHEHTTRKRDHAYRLWSLLVLEAWHRVFVDPPTVSITAPHQL